MQAMGSRFWDYDFRDNNCQDFIQALLSANGLLTSQAKTFIQQNVADTLAKDIPKVSSDAALAATDLRGILKSMFGGSAKLRRTVQRKPRMAAERRSTIPLDHLWTEEGAGLWDFAASIGKQALKEGVKTGAVEGSKALGSHLGKAAGDATGRRIVSGKGVEPVEPMPLNRRTASRKELVYFSLSGAQQAKLRRLKTGDKQVIQLSLDQLKHAASSSSGCGVYITQRDKQRLDKAVKQGTGARLAVYH
jgi:hypothetical protein